MAPDDPQQAKTSAPVAPDPPRRIFDEPPGSWRDLQSKVAQTFIEIGCDAAVDRTVSLPRGSVKLDVAVHDPTTPPHSLYVCECKYWARRVPKSAVHAFRTVVSEMGAHRGFLISRAGFQRGALEAVEYTNLDLLDWHQFESLMFDRWLAGVSNNLDAMFEPVARLLDSSNHQIYRKLDRIGRSAEDWHEMIRRYPLLTAWNLFVRHTAVGFKGIAKLGIEVRAENGTQQKLDTHRKVVDYAPGECHKAAQDVIAFFKVDLEDGAPGGNAGPRQQEGGGPA